MPLEKTFWAARFGMLSIGSGSLDDQLRRGDASDNASRALDFRIIGAKGGTRDGEAPSVGWFDRLRGVERTVSRLHRCANACLHGPEANSPTSTSRVDFQREIRPILSDNCFQCHGPDESARKADLRLDLREGALDAAAERRSDRARKAGAKPPLQKDHRRESRPADAAPFDAQNAERRAEGTIKLWIEQGADWKQHWAFVAPVRPRCRRSKIRNGRARRSIDLSSRTSNKPASRPMPKRIAARSFAGCRWT